MKNTGIVRRIDELGRVVIPKELRRTMRIKEGEEMEVFVSPDDTLVLKKYSVLRDYSEVAKDYVDILGRHVKGVCFVCDTDVIVASAEKKLLGKRISVTLEQLLQRRKTVRLSGREAFCPCPDTEMPREIVVSPIVEKGDVLGGVVVFGASVGETGEKLAQVAAGFLEKQFE